MSTIRVRVLTAARERRHHDGTVTYNCIGIDDKSRIAYISFSEGFRTHMTEGLFIAVVNCRVHKRLRNISVMLQRQCQWLLMCGCM